MAAILQVLTSCRLANRNRSVSGPIQAEEKLAEGKGDAYLFDMKITRNGKKNSVRLDVYRTADSIAFFARGYLGKGVVKGLLTAESLLVYFPTENEFYTGPMGDLLGTGCFEDMPFERLLLDIFDRVPAEFEDTYRQYYLNILKESKNERRYRLIARNCPETIDIQYDLKERRYIPERFEYENQDGSLKIRASRRKYRLNTGLPAEKFRVPITSDAVEILP